ncbi:MAG: response regulator [Planctomycetota bacterium]|nr:MAG: response regulator [Planctomycetota bacterium]
MADDQKTILVVDDEPDTLEFLTTVLQDGGFATVSARDGNEALSQIDEKAPDLIALDISMPEKSGVAVYRALKQDERLKDIPVIIITGISDEFKRFISTRKQVPPPEGYISKPVDHEDLLKMVNNLI